MSRKIIESHSWKWTWSHVLNFSTQSDTSSSSFSYHLIGILICYCHVANFPKTLWFKTAIIYSHAWVFSMTRWLLLHISYLPLGISGLIKACASQRDARNTWWHSQPCKHASSTSRRHIMCTNFWLPKESHRARPKFKMLSNYNARARMINLMWAEELEPFVHPAIPGTCSWWRVHFPNRIYLRTSAHFLLVFYLRPCFL